jgi:diaminohydroxyphosphoribosylaminopyrimidine deaminase/5-amino-6-(5-phosphoribosylamino)uracil reductase
MSTEARDSERMTLAIRIGEQGRRTAPPNPWVGCVIVDRTGAVVGTGFHERPGTPHAEVHALAEAGERARGGTAYTTLEPCSHHGRTPPCVDALVEAAVARVVVALEDPDDRVAGAGIDRLRSAGIAVDLGTGADAAAASLRAYLHHRRTGRPYTVLKTAVSVDGRTAAADGSSRWITGPEARADAHRLRAESQAVMVGAGTALADRPTLTVRDVDGPVGPQPLRVLLDGSGRVPAEGPLFDVALAPTLVYTSERAPGARVDEWRAAGAKVVAVRRTGSELWLDSVLAGLAGRDVLQVLVEGGPTLHASFVRACLADRLVAYIGNVTLGPDALPMLAAPVTASLAAAPRWHLEHVARAGHDVRLDYEPADGTRWWRD